MEGFGNGRSPEGGANYYTPNQNQNQHINNPAEGVHPTLSFGVPPRSQSRNVSPNGSVGNSSYWSGTVPSQGQVMHGNLSSSPSLEQYVAPVETEASLPKEVFLTDYGTRLKLSGDLKGAMEQYFEASKVNPAYAPAYYNIGVIFSEMEQFDDALAHYHNALDRNPEYVEAYCNIGVIFKNQGKPEKAVEYYERALEVSPNFKIARSNIAIALTDLGTKIKNQGDVVGCIQYYKKALQYNALYPDAYYNLGVAYGELGIVDKAIICYELGIHFNPTCCEAYNNLGVIFKDEDNLERAEECYSSALQVNPRYHQALNNLSVIKTMQGKMDEAYETIALLLDSNPQFAEAYNNLGVLHRDQGEMESAISCFRSCLEKDPQSLNAAHNLLLALNYRKRPVEEVFDVHRKWGADFCGVAPPPLPYQTGNRYDKKQLRIGYICPDFFVHHIASFMTGIIRSHSQEKCKIFCYSDSALDGKHYLDSNTTFRNVYNRCASDVATMINRDCIDILVELSGHTADNRLDVLALRPAPIQIAYLGYPNTTGLPSIQYRLCDHLTDPEGSKQLFTETLVRMQYCFLCYQPPKIIPVLSPPPCHTGVITFGCLGNLAKVTPTVIGTWCALLRAIPNSRLLMRCKPFATEYVRDKFIQRFTSRGIEAHRIDLWAIFPRNFEHLAAYELIDISLDTWPFNGTIETCESLFMGVPVVTMRGDCHASNIGTSILHQVGLDSWVASKEEDYINIACRNSTLPILAMLRQSLRNTLLQSNICKSKAFTENLEEIYFTMWKQHCSALNVE